MDVLQSREDVKIIAMFEDMVVPPAPFFQSIFGNHVDFFSVL